MGQLVNIMESPVRRLTFGEMGDNYPEGKTNALGDDAESVAYRKKYIESDVYKGEGINPFFAKTTRTVEGVQIPVLNSDDNYRIQCSYFECYSIQDLYRFYIEPNIIIASKKLQTQIDVISKMADNSNSTSSKRVNGLVSKTQWSGTTGAPVLFTEGQGYVNKASTGKLGVVKDGTNTSIGSNGEVDVPTANGSTLGVVKQGNYVTIDNGTISANVATNSALGVVKPKTNGNINITNGEISVPIASSRNLGVVMVGDNLTIGTNGKLNAIDTNTEYPAADDDSPNIQGTVKPGSGTNKGNISWKDGVGRVLGYKGFRLNPDNGEFMATPTLASSPGEDNVAYLDLSDTNAKFYESPFIPESRENDALYISGPRKIIYPVDPGNWINNDLSMDPVYPLISKCFLGIRFNYTIIKKALDSFGVLDIELEFLHNVFSRDIGTSAWKNTTPSLLIHPTWGGFRLWDYTGFLEKVNIVYIRPPKPNTQDSVKEVQANIGGKYEEGPPFTQDKWNGGVSDKGDKYTPAVCIPTYANEYIATYVGKSLNFRFRKSNDSYSCDIYPHLITTFSHSQMLKPGW